MGWGRRVPFWIDRPRVDGGPREAYNGQSLNFAMSHITEHNNSNHATCVWYTSTKLIAKNVAKCPTQWKIAPRTISMSLEYFPIDWVTHARPHSISLWSIRYSTIIIADNDYVDEDDGFIPLWPVTYSTILWLLCHASLILAPSRNLIALSRVAALFFLYFDVVASLSWMVSCYFPREEERERLYFYATSGSTEIRHTTTIIIHY